MRTGSHRRCSSEAARAEHATSFAIGRALLPAELDWRWRAALPYPSRACRSPLASVLGFVPPPPAYWWGLTAILGAYAIATEAGKAWLTRRFGIA